jgi:hypothetical protein
MKKTSAFILCMFCTTAFICLSGMPPVKKAWPDTWYVYTGFGNAINETTEPLHYQLVSAPPASSTPDNFLQAIQVESASEVYTSGPYFGLPKVDQPGVLQDDILDATGYSDGTVNEIADRVLLKQWP